MAFLETSLDLDAIIKYMFDKGPVEHNFSLSLLHELFRRSELSLTSQPSLLTLQGPLNICGDIHGQYADLLNIFQRCGYPFNTRYLFLGDYVDRGRNSLEVIVLLFALQLRFPQNIYLLRGNHEIKMVNKSYGFMAELRTRYHQNNNWEPLFDAISKTFSQLPIAALVYDKMLCLHGGISPNLKSLNDLKNIKRGEENPTGLLEELLWADPSEDCTGFKTNESRGCSFEFGDEAINNACKKLGIYLIVRGHQVIDEGVQFTNKKRVLTLFSAPGYSEEYHNKAAVMNVSSQKMVSFTYLHATEMTTEKNKFIPQSI